RRPSCALRMTDFANSRPFTCSAAAVPCAVNVRRCDSTSYSTSAPSRKSTIWRGGMGTLLLQKCFSPLHLPRTRASYLCDGSGLTSRYGPGASSPYGWTQGACHRPHQLRRDGDRGVTP